MRMLHTSDWHLGRLFFGESLTEEQATLLREFVAAAKDLRPDVILIAGDVYDRSVPPADAVELLDEVLARLVLEAGFPVLMISGNHDSGKRLAFGNRFFDRSRLHVCSAVFPGAVRLADAWGPVDFMLLPYADTETVRLELDADDLADADAAIGRRRKAWTPPVGGGNRTVALAHAFLAGGKPSESERPLSVGGTGAAATGHFDGFHYTAMGHLHRPQLIAGGRLAYSGSLMKYSFDEAGQDKGFYFVEMDGAGNLRQEFLPLRPRRDVRVIAGSFQDLMKGAAAGNPDDYLSITLLDEAPVIQAIQRLRTVYPNTMEISYRYQQEALALSPSQRPDSSSRSALELFETFAEWSTQKSLTAPQREIMTKLLTDAVGGGGNE